MSILIAQNISGLLTSVGFFGTGATKPLTPVAFVKVDAFGSTGFLQIPVIQADGGTGFMFAGFSRNSALREIRVSEHNGTTSGTAVLSMGEELVAKWKPIVGPLISPTNRAAWSTDAAGALVSATDATNREALTATDLRLFGATWPDSPLRAAYIGVYEATLTEAQILEFCTSGQVAGLTPYALWNATEDWGAGQLLDVSGNGRHLTVPANWTYSADNPVFLSISSVNAGSLLSGSAGNTITFSSAFTPTSITMGGLTATAITQVSPTQYTFSWPALADITSHPGFGTRTIAASDGVDSLTFDVSNLPPTGHTHIDLAGTLDTTSDASIIKNFSPAAAVGDQIAAQNETTLAADGTATTTITGTQTAWHWDQSTSTIYSFEIITGSALGRLLTARGLTATGPTARDLTAVNL